MPSLKHIHRYRKVKLQARRGQQVYVIYACDLKGCTHTLPKELVIGKVSICHRCKREFTITKDRLRGATYLFCRDCHRPKNETLELPPIPGVLP